MTGVVFLDLKKAFDTVNHRILLLKLGALGVDSPSAAWFKSYLNNRTQQTVIGKVASSPRNVDISGVPQGSVLGPLFFLVHINDLAECLQISQATLFADDTAIYCSVPSSENLQTKLNEDLLRVKEWLNSHELSLNVSKTTFMVIGGRQRLSHMNTLDLVIDKDTIEQVDHLKYLGVIINEKLTWCDHIDYIQSKVAKRLGMLKRIKHLLPVKSRELVFNTLIFPILD